MVVVRPASCSHCPWLSSHIVCRSIAGSIVHFGQKRNGRSTEFMTHAHSWWFRLPKSGSSHRSEFTPVETSRPDLERSCPEDERAYSKIPSIFDHVVRNSSTIKSNYQLPDGVTRNQTIMPLIVRGLHQHYLGTPLPQGVTFEVGRVIERSRMEAILRDMWANGGSLRKIRNGDVFECYFAPRRDEPYFEVWVLNFYKCIRYLVSIKNS